MNLSGLNPKDYVNFNEISIGSGRPQEDVPTTPNMNQTKQKQTQRINQPKQKQELTEEEKTILGEKYNKRIMESTGNKKETNKINPMNRLNMTTSSTKNLQKQTTRQLTSRELAKLLFPNKKKRKRTNQK